jgi:hypothetical protein
LGLGSRADEDGIATALGVWSGKRVCGAVRYAIWRIKGAISAKFDLASRLLSGGAFRWHNAAQKNRIEKYSQLRNDMQ